MYCLRLTNGKYNEIVKIAQIKIYILTLRLISNNLNAVNSKFKWEILLKLISYVSYYGEVTVII